jgi:alkylresorcinol/alkylpyrone synthase
VGARRANRGPSVVASRSVFYPQTEEVMGWEITSEGFRVVLSADVPKVVRDHIREDVEHFLADKDLSLDEISSYVCHPGGPKVLEALQAALDLPEGALALTWDSLKSVGNLSSASVLMVLRDTLERRRPVAGSHGLMLAMGPGFCSELVLLRW